MHGSTPADNAADQDVTKNANQKDDALDGSTDDAVGR